MNYFVSFFLQTILFLLLSLVPSDFNSLLANAPILPEYPASQLTDTSRMHALQASLHMSEGKNIKEARLRKNNYRIKKVVIDPGHGGHDPGCLGSLTYEKHIALGIGLRLASFLQANYPDVEVIMTRKDDTFIPLHQRAQIANQNNADLFLSIHCNYIPKRSDVRGSETYVLGPHKLEENLDVAMRENAAILLEDNYEENYNFDPNSAEGHIILSMYQNAYLEQSILFAEMVEKHMAQTASRNSRGVKQAGFLVLRETAMPSVLIETGFLSNRLEEEFLLTDQGQKMIAQAVFTAFEEYKIELEGTEPLVALQPKGASDLKPMSGGTSQNSQATEQPKPKAYEAPAETFDSPKTATGQSRAINQDKTPTYPAAAPTNTSSFEPPPSRKPSTKKLVMPELIQFRVQLAASPEPLQQSHQYWDAVGYLVQVIQEDDLYKYQARGFNSFEEAAAVREQLRKKGFKDAFVVAYRNNERISIQEAVKSRK